MANQRIYWLHAITPTHVGIGRGLDYIDLPIDRDKVTNWPIVRGSGFKGVWRDWAVQEKKPSIETAFGRADKDGEAANSGALIPTDAKLVCLPVRSFRGTFAWCTSSLCLQMLRRTLELSGVKDLPVAPTGLPDDKSHVTTTSVLKEGDRLFLEDLDFKAEECKTATAWAEKLAAWVFPNDAPWQTEFVKRFAVLPDEAFNFLTETGTEVHTRVKIDDETKTVADGALWTEESLPAETILAGVIKCDRVFGGDGKDITPTGLLDKFAKDSLTLQLGGKATVGRGQVRCVFTTVNGGGQ